MKVELRGDKITLWVDGKRVFCAEEDGRRGGRVGFRTWAGGARFRNVTITDPAGKRLWEGLPELEP